MPIKLIVTHKSPDLDAVASVWLLKRFDEQNFGQAQLAFVNPGEEISLEALTELGHQSYEIVHVDTGGGEFDHHVPERSNQDICAASLVLDHIRAIHPEISDDQALSQIINHVIQVDHYAQAYWPERNDTRAYFMISEILPSLKNIGLSDSEVVEYGLVSLDAIHSKLTVVIKANQDLEKATKFDTPWGNGVICETANNQFVDQAQRQGYVLAVRKDPEYGHVQIKALPDKKIDLTEIYEKIRDRDGQATWYFHPSKTMLLNGSDKNRDQVSSQLSLQQIIDLFQSK